MEAASRGNAEAQFNLAMMCENGAAKGRYTSEANHSEAMRWLLAAATQGLSRAQIKLAEFYALEAETPEGSVKACGWYLVATANLEGIRLKEAQAAYRRLSDQLTPAQRDEAAAVRRELEADRPGAHRGFGPSRARQPARDQQLVCSTDRAPDRVWSRFRGACSRASAPVTALVAEELALPGGADAASLARDMIEVHGGEAATIARHNARAAALGSQPQQAKSWLRVVDLIQRQQADKPASARGADRPLSPPPSAT